MAITVSQSVVGAFADMYGFTEEQAFRMSASFGGGIGRMRQTCGAACGMFLLAGLEKGAVEGKDREGKAANYALVQELAAEFKKRNGSLICAELLGLRNRKVRPFRKPVPSSIMLNAVCQDGRGSCPNLDRIPGKNVLKVRKKNFFYPLVRKKVPNNVLYNINIPIFAAI